MSNKKYKILILRFHAFGDVIAILPYINGLRSLYPKSQIDLITTKRVESIPASTKIFDDIIGVKGKMAPHLVFIWTILKIPLLMLRRYDMLIDLQNDRKSNIITQLLSPKTPSAFEKFTPLFAGLRYENAIRKVGFDKLKPDFKIKLKYKDMGLEKLFNEGYNGQDKLIVLNPAGYFVTRNWPLENYLHLIELLKNQSVFSFRILLLGDARIKEKAIKIKQCYPELTINLVNKTNQVEAFTLLRRATLVISEDSGLAHMAWVQGVKILLMLGSTRSDWTTPPYEHVINLNSSDLECGDCMQPTCKFGDTRCLTRYSSEFVFSKIIEFI